MKPCLSHERLQVYQAALKFVAQAARMLESVPKNIAVWDPLDRASTSIPLNIAEGNGKFTPPDRCRYFDNARGSALECAACLDVLSARKQATEADVTDGKATLHSIVSMLFGLMHSNSPDRLDEDPAPDRVESGQDRED